MLVLTRKIGERIRIGDTVTVRVLEVRGSQVRLGVEAPPEVRIFREEIYHPEGQPGEPEGEAAPQVNGAINGSRVRAAAQAGEAATATKLTGRRTSLS